MIRTSTKLLLATMAVGIPVWLFPHGSIARPALYLMAGAMGVLLVCAIVVFWKEGRES